MLTLNEIKAAHGPREFIVNVPAWNGDIKIRRLTAADWIALAERPNDESQLDYLIRLIELTAVNGSDKPLFDAESRYLLTDSPLVALDLGTKIVELNKLNREKKSDSPTVT
jgi:hypothetical protein